MTVRPQRPRRSKTAILLGIAVLLTLATLAIRSGHPSRRLPDGTQLTLREVRFSDGFRFSAGVPGWARWVERLVPGTWRIPWLQRLRGGAVTAPRTGHPQLFLATGHAGLPEPGLPRLERVWVRDTDGAVFEAATDALTVGWPGLVEQVWPLRAFPRRAPFLTVQFVGRGDDGTYQPLAEFRVPNPEPGPHPVWQPEPLPIARGDADRRVVLTDFVAGVTHPGGGGYWEGRRGTRLTFQVPASMPWELRSLEVSDATGNRWEPAIESQPAGGTPGRQVAEFVGALWPGESAWKLRAEFAPTNDFDPGEVVGIDVPIPGNGEVLPLNQVWNVGGVAVTGVAVAGLGAALPEPFGALRVVPGPALALQARARAAERRLRVVGAADDRGREVAVTEGYRWQDDQQTWTFGVADGVRSVKVRLAAPRSQFHEYLAAPRQAGP